MKRGFLFGLWWFLLLSIPSPMIMAMRNPDERNAAVTLILPLTIGTLAFITRYFAKQAPPNFSKLHAIVGWFLGFFVIDLVALVLAGVWYWFGDLPVYALITLMVVAFAFLIIRELYRTIR